MHVVTSALIRSSMTGRTLVGLALGCLAITSARAQAPSNPFPSFPQSFALDSPVPAGFPLAVTQPGTIAVDVDTTGSPVMVTLQSPGLPPLQREGSGHLTLSYKVSPADVQRSKLWTVTVALMPPPPMAPPPSAAGTVRIHQPPADVGAALAEVNAIARMPKAHRGPGPQDLAKIEAARATAQAQYDQRVREAQAQREAQNQPLIDQLRRGAPTALGTRSLPPLGITQIPVAGAPVASALPPPTGVTTKTITSTPPPPPPPAPVITALQSSANASLTQAGPLDQIVIVGKNFGTIQSDIVFQIGTKTFPTTSLPGCWSDTLIVVKVPDIAGFPQSTAGVWVQLNPAGSNVASFTFTPALEYRHIYWTQDNSLSPGAQTSYVAATKMGDVYHANTTYGSMGGSAGNDMFFFNTSLNPAWVPQGVSFIIYGTGMPAGSGGVYVQQSGFAANPPAVRFNARWYYNAFQDIDYGFDVLIAGPRGTPDGIVVTQ